MSTTVDVFLKFNGSRRKLLRFLGRELQIAFGKGDTWLLGFINIEFCSRYDDPDYFRSRHLRGYNFVVGGTSYAWSAQFGTARHVDITIFDAIAQVIAVRLKTRTMITVLDWGVERRYRYIRPMKRNKYSAVIDEKTGKIPKGLF